MQTLVALDSKTLGGDQQAQVFLLVWGSHSHLDLLVVMKDPVLRRETSGSRTLWRRGRR